MIEGLKKRREMGEWNTIINWLNFTKRYCDQSLERCRITERRISSFFFDEISFVCFLFGEVRVGKLFIGLVLLLWAKSVSIYIQKKNNNNNNKICR